MKKLLSNLRRWLTSGAVVWVIVTIMVAIYHPNYSTGGAAMFAVALAWMLREINTSQGLKEMKTRDQVLTYLMVAVLFGGASIYCYFFPLLPC